MMRRLLARPAVVAGTALLIACNSADSPGEPPETDARVELTIGGMEEGPASFTDVRGIAVDDRGAIYVLEARAQQVRVFDSLGRFVRSIGRRGQGPGEFVSANGIALDRDGRLVVYDPNGGRVTVFDTAGQVHRQRTVPISSYGFVWEGGVDSLGRVLDSPFAVVGGTERRIIRRISLETDQVDTIPWPECGLPVTPFYRFPGGSGMQVPFASGGYTWLDPDGDVWCAVTNEAKAVRHPFGALAADSIASRATPAAVAEAERDSAVRAIETFKRRAGDAPVDLGLIPSVKPLLLGVGRSHEGKVWMHLQDSAGRVLDLFEPDGEWAGRVRLPVKPSRWHPIIVRGGRIHALTHDSLDVPVVARLRVDGIRR